MSGQSKTETTTVKEAMSADRLADLAHELRSPLGGIEAMIALLAETRAASDQEKLIAGLQAASAHLRSVANTLLQPQKMTAHAVAVGDCLRLFAVAAASRAEKRGLSFRYDIPEACGEAILGDGVAVRQMLENLIDNAVRHAEGGEIRLQVAAIRGAGQGDCMRFVVINAGRSITIDEARLMFQRHETLPGAPAGSGLGLSIVASLAAAMGGSCGAEPCGGGSGVSVWFTVPVIGYRQKQKPVPLAPASGGSRLLVVDDDATNQLLLKTVLEHMGYSVETTGSPCDALRKLGSGSYDAVLTDMGMPEMDGWTLIREIRASAGQVARVPIIAVTGRVTPDDKARVMEAGGNWVVEKPVTIHDLRKALVATGLRDPMARQVSNAA